MNDLTYSPMKASATELTLRETIAAGAYFLIFPFFFFYHSLAGLNVMTPILGNWWTASHMLTLAALTPIAISALNKRSILLHLPFIAVIFICGFVGIYNYEFGEPYAKGGVPLAYTGKMIASWLGLYFLGLLLPLNERFATILAAGCGVIFFLTVFLVDARALRLYQYLSQALVFSAIIPLAFFWGDKRGAALGGMTLAALIYLASRSELIGFSAVLVGWAIYVGVHRRWALIPIMCVTALVAAVAITGVLSGAAGLRTWMHKGSAVMQASAIKVPAARIGAHGSQARTESPKAISPPPFVLRDPIARQSELADLSHSRSFQLRMSFLKSGWRGIMSNPIFGDYAGQIREFNDPGSYIHNILSVWRQYGLLAFILYAGLSLAAAVIPIRIVLTGKETSPHWLLAAMVGGYCLVLVVASKAVFWPLPALAWGLLASCYSSLKRVN